MTEIDPGHKYELRTLDGPGPHLLQFVKREGEKYPGNIGSYPGVNLQEVMRACIARMLNLDSQDHHWINPSCVVLLRCVIMLLERRAAERHGREVPEFAQCVEQMPVCLVCGHIGCAGHGPV